MIKQGFIQSTSINSLCSVQQHLSDINIFSIFSCECDNARMLRDGRDIDNIDIETSHESRVSPPIRDHDVHFLTNKRRLKCKCWHPCSCRVAILSHHQNISAQYFTILGNSTKQVPSCFRCLLKALNPLNQYFILHKSDIGRSPWSDASKMLLTFDFNQTNCNRQKHSRETQTRFCL